VAVSCRQGTATVTLHPAMKAQRYGSTISVTLEIEGGGWVVNATPWPRDPVPIVQERGWTPRQVWKGADNLAPTGKRSSNGTGLVELLYRLSYAGPLHGYIL